MIGNEIDLSFLNETEEDKEARLAKRRTRTANTMSRAEINQAIRAFKEDDAPNEDDERGSDDEMQGEKAQDAAASDAEEGT